MFKTFLACGSILCATFAHGFSLSVSTSFNKLINDASKNYEGVFGVSTSQPIGMGLGWWSWTGVGRVMQLDKDEPIWYSHTQGIDLNLHPVKFGIKGGVTMDDNQDIKGNVAVKMQIQLM